ncbi:MAG: hypothetical protein ACOCRO_07685 [Halanaerobiales bacterium]
METTIQGTIDINEPTKFINSLPIIYSIIEYIPPKAVYTPGLSSGIAISF